MRICVVQMAVHRGDRAANYAAVERMTAEAMRSETHPQVMILPELWSTGYALKQAEVLASEEGAADAEFLAGLAQRYDVTFAGGSVLASCQGKIFNRAQVIDASGKLAAFYDKVHLFCAMQEDVYLTAGNSPRRFEMYGMPCASVICYDIRFCELTRKLAVMGAELLTVSAEWPLVRCEQWMALLKARAIENQMYVAACNCCDVSGKELFAGHSMIIAPDGTVLAQAGTEEGLLFADVNRDEVGRIRNSLHIFAERRPEVYGAF